jgi:hypothetical protein
MMQVDDRVASSVAKHKLRPAGADPQSHRFKEPFAFFSLRFEFRLIQWRSDIRLHRRLDNSSAA